MRGGEGSPDSPGRNLFEAEILGAFNTLIFLASEWKIFPKFIPLSAHFLVAGVQYILIVLEGLIIYKQIPLVRRGKMATEKRDRYAWP